MKESWEAEMHIENRAVTDPLIINFKRDLWWKWFRWLALE